MSLKKSGPFDNYFSLCSLICSATYTVHLSGEELFLRKFFKFNVFKDSLALSCLYVSIIPGGQAAGREDKVHECGRPHSIGGADPEHHSQPHIPRGGKL